MKKRRTFKHYLVDGMDSKQVGNNISWSSVLAGVVTFIALSVLFSLVSASIGLGVTDLTANNPLAGVGTGMIVWTIISFVLSLAAAGFVAGLSANRAGVVHGFLTWAVSLVVIIFIATSTVSSVFGAIGSLLGHTGNAVGNVVGNTTQVAATLTQDAFDNISQQVSIDTENLDKAVVEALEKTEIEQLQPNYLQAQLDATIADVKDAGHRVIVQGEDIQVVTEEVLQNVETRLTAIGESLDEETLKTEIAKNTDLTATEVDKAVANIKSAYETTQTEAKRLLNQAKMNIETLRVQAEAALAESIQTTNDVMNATAKYSLVAFFGLVLAAVAASSAGYYGSKVGEAGHNL